MQDKASFIEIKGAQTNNLKNIDLRIPKNKLVVFVGLSGSGKSSVTMDTLFAEGQRRYVESLSSYARQFLGRMKKPEVDYISGICPAIAIEQHGSKGSARSTVGSLTEIVDFMRLLFARAGRTYSPISGDEVRKHQVGDVVDHYRKLPPQTKVLVLAPIQNRFPERSAIKEMEMLMQRGYNRYYHNGSLHYIEDWVAENADAHFSVTKLRKDGYYILIDRFIKSEEEKYISRLTDAVGVCFGEFYGVCVLEIDGKKLNFNNRFELDGMTFEEPSVHLFNANNPMGACPTCEGYGKVIGITEEKVIPNPYKSVYDGAIACWAGSKGQEYINQLIRMNNPEFPVFKPYIELSEKEQKLLWKGSRRFLGIDKYFEGLEKKLYKIQNRVILSRFRGKTTCPECMGSKLKKEANYVKIDGFSFGDLYHLSIDQLHSQIKSLKLDEFQSNISERLIDEISLRLHTLERLGLSYLQLDRSASSLSGGEAQRIQLTRLLASTLTDSMYILDEPSIGLHPRDTARMTEVLQELRDLDNTVIVVEHEEAVIRSADYIIEIGPGAGIHGGTLVYQGEYHGFVKDSNSLTAQYLRGERSVPVPKYCRKPVQFIQIEHATLHNLKDICVRFPLQCIAAVTGVSGSGKTTLVRELLVKAVEASLEENPSIIDNLGISIIGDLDQLDAVEYVSQNPLGRSSRSNPATYVNAYDHIRALMASQASAKLNGLTSGSFSFNVNNGRCEKCLGEGEIVIEMQFLADVKLTCDECKGKKFQKRILEVKYKDKNIYDILELSIEEALLFFTDESKIVKKLKPLLDVGLGYLKLGQASNTFSGGEAQRVKLASYLSNHKKGSHHLFVFDEPTTGLHFEDVNFLMRAFNDLVECGHSIIIIEHNMDVIRSADWIIDMGPDGGAGGGELLYQGAPKGLKGVKRSHTASFL